MNRDEILQRLQDVLDGHVKHYLGYLGQEPYKSNLFELFRLAYNGGHFDVNAAHRLTGDAIRDSFNDRWFIDLDDNERSVAQDVVDDLLRRWDEWHYAWDKRE